MSRVIAWALLLVTFVAAPIAFALAVVAEGRQLELPPNRESILVLAVVATAAALLYAVVGFVIARKRPENPIGWIFLGSAPMFALVGLAYGYADLSLYAGEAWPGGTWAAWLTNWLFAIPVFATPILVAQLFPTGRVVSARWRWALWFTVGVGALELLGSALRVAQLDTYPDVENPLGVPGTGGDAFVDVWNLREITLSPAVFVVVLASLVVRFRRSRGIEREQLKWLAFALVVLVIGFAVASLTQPSVVSDVFFVIAIAALVFIPVAVAIAILRYRLYAIDRVITRTLVYGSLTVILGAAYVGLVLAGQAVFSSFAGGGGLAIAVSTLVVAALFLPVRSRVQRFVDRRFYRRRYDAQRTLEAFGARLREEIDLATLSADLRSAVTETMQPSHVTVWTRKGL